VPPLHAGKATLLLDDPRTIRSQPDNEPYAPFSFFVSGDTITIPDTVNNVLGIYRDNKRIRAITMPEISCCFDLRGEGGHYWLLDGDHNVYEYSLSPGATSLVKLGRHHVDGDQPTWLDTEGANVVVQMFDGKRVLVSGSGPVAPGARFEMLEHGWTIDDGTIKADLSVRYEPVSIHLLARTGLSNYYWVYDENPRVDRSPNYGYLYELSTMNGELLRTYTLKTPGVTTPNRGVLVSDGRVYQMIVTNRSTKVYRIEANP
jgi:hypothetical protein